MTSWDLLALSPIVAIGILALVTFGLDAVLGVVWRARKLGNPSWLPWIVIAALIVPFLLTLNLWFGWIGDSASATTYGIGEMEAQQVGVYGGKVLFGSFDPSKFTLFFQLLILVATAVVLIASTRYLRQFADSRGEFIGLMLIASTGTMLLVGATELITIYVALEMTALPVVALAAIRRDAHSVEGALKFLVLSAISTAMLLFGLVMLYGVTGATQLELVIDRVGEIAAVSGQPFGSYALMLSLLLIVAGFGFKMAIAPWHMWVPDVYQGSPAPVGAYLSVASKASAFAVLIRILIYYGGGGSETQDWQLLFAVVAAVSMSVGNLLALSQSNVKRLLAYSTVAQAGYIVVALTTTLGGSAIGSATGGMSAAMYYLAGYAFTNLAVWLAYTAVLQRIGDDSIEGLRGLFRRSRVLSILLVIGLLSLLGMPPTVGFMAKAVVFSNAVDQGLVWLAIIAVINTVVAAYYYLKVVGVIMFGDADEDAPEVKPNAAEMTAVGVGVVGTLLLGIVPALVLTMIDTATIG